MVAMRSWMRRTLGRHTDGEPAPVPDGWRAASSPWGEGAAFEPRADRAPTGPATAGELATSGEPAAAAVTAAPAPDVAPASGVAAAPAPDVAPGFPPVREDLPRIGFVGAGRAGTALGVALRRAGWPVTAVASRDQSRRDRFAELVPGARPFADAGAIIDEVDLVVLSVPDDAIAAVAASMRLYSGQAIIHLSGLLPASVLAPAQAAGTEAGSFHPLVAFAELDAALAAMPGARVAIEGDEALLPLLRDLADALGMLPFTVGAAGKAAHHAAAVLAAAGVVALLDAVVELAASAGVEADAALDAYGGLARQGLRNAESLGVTAALTGPAVRGDAGTLAAHLDALHRLAPDVLPLYRAISVRAVHMAARRGELSPERTDELLALLASEA
jgi:predicted short-subunit dehydrogenase-like oxidoreductase (DUF2520 family)